MNLLENERQMQKNKKARIIMMVIMVCIILLIALGAVIMYMIQDVEKNTTKLIIDTKRTSNFSTDMFLFEDNTIYISIRDFAELVGYNGYNGDYTSEGLTKGYIRNDYEEASYTLNSNKLYKKLLDSKDNEYYHLEKPVKIQNNKLYMSIDGVMIAANCSIQYEEENKKFTVYTLPYLASIYVQTFNDAAIIGDEVIYSNQKALLYNIVVVRALDAEGNPTGNYGVKNTEGKEIIGTKYKSIKFIESTGEFIVTTDNNKMGTVSLTGVTRIPIAYDEIRQIDKNLNLYLVKNSNKYGVIKQNGDVVIHLEYNQIGIDTTQFESNNIKNQYLLFDNCIPVLRDKKWGFFDKAGKKIVDLQYSGIGCVIGTQEGTSNQNLLIIPDYEAIVVEKETKKGKRYGLVNSLGEELIGCVLDAVYSVVTSGQEIYWMEQIKNETTTAKFNILDWLQQHGKQKPIKPNEENTSTNIGDNTATNEVTENTIQNVMTTNVIGNTTTNNVIANDTTNTIVPQTGNTTVSGNNVTSNVPVLGNTTQTGR